VQSVFWYFEPFRRDSRVWRTDRQTDGRTDSLVAYAALRYMMRGQKLETSVDVWAFIARWRLVLNFCSSFFVRCTSMSPLGHNKQHIQNKFSNIASPRLHAVFLADCSFIAQYFAQPCFMLSWTELSEIKPRCLEDGKFQ